MIGSKYMKRLCTIIHKVVAMVDTVVWIMDPKKKPLPVQNDKEKKALHLHFRDDNESLLLAHGKTSGEDFKLESKYRHLNNRRAH